MRPARRPALAILVSAALAASDPRHAAAGAAPPEAILRIRNPEAWHAEPAWLGNPATRFDARRGSEGVIFRVRDPGRGMKWRRALDRPIPLAAFRHVTIRYRAVGAARTGDYVLAILGGPEGGAEGYRTPILPAQLRAGGRWRHASGELGDAAGRWTLRGIAIQVQAAGEPAEIEIAEVRFTRDAPRAPIAEVLPLERIDAMAPPFEAIDIAPLATVDASKLRGALGLRDWLPAGEVACCGVPFRVLAGPRSAATTDLEGEGRIRVPLSGRAAEIALLLAARLAGDEEPSLGSGPLRELRGVDRAAFRIEYAGGAADEMLGLSLPEDRFAVAGGPQVAILFADPARDLEALEILDRSERVELVLLAATAVRSAEGRFAARRPRHRPLPPARLRRPTMRPPRVVVRGTRIDIESGAIRATVELEGLRLEHLESAWVGGGSRVGSPSRLVRLAAGGKAIEPDAWSVTGIERSGPARVAFAASVRAGGADLTLRGEIAADANEIRWTCEVAASRGSPDLAITAPLLEGLRVRDPATDRLFYPKRGAVLTARPCAFSRPASGLFPVGFIDLSAPAGGGVYLRTEDRDGLDRLFEAGKDAGGARMAVAYPGRRLAPGAPRRIAPTAIGVHGGDWHETFGAYGRWLSTWYAPRRPLKPWFREIFNFRQRFLWFWDPIYDRESGRFRIREAIEEARVAFGGLEVLHLMDWGTHPKYGRVYGRTGDHAPWEVWKGGKASFVAAIREAGRAGVPVGLYVEGYLLEERGKLGGPGKAWQIRGPRGERRHWPNSTEMYICPRVAEWKAIQVDTYRRLATMFPIRGVYIDQFGFADWGKTCWSRAHGHPVPATPLRGERDLTGAVSEALSTIDPTIAIYTEETPCDAANGFQDGSFTYAMNDALRSPTDVPLNIARFAFPAFKTFEILVCDRPTGSWATGVLWTFFNGEGIWLEGPAASWFRPRTREAIRRAHAILRRHREAFTTLRPEPLVPTRVEGIHANRFPGEREVVYTLWNALPCTFRGRVLAIAPGEGRRFIDAWNERDIAPQRRRDGTLAVPVEIAPFGAGCVVVER